MPSGLVANPVRLDRNGPGRRAGEGWLRAVAIHWMKVSDTGTFRFTYMLATHKRDELSRDWRGDEMEKLAKAARELQDLLQGTESR